MGFVRKIISEFLPNLFSILLPFLSFWVLYWSHDAGNFLMVYQVVVILLIWPCFCAVLMVCIYIILEGSSLIFSRSLALSWLPSLFYIVISLHFPSRGPNIMWQNNHRVAESMWVLPFSNIRTVYFVREETDEIQVDLVFYREGRPRLRRRYNQEERELRQFVREQIIAMADFPEEKKTKQLREEFQDLPPGLEGVIFDDINLTFVNSGTTKI